MRAVWLRELGPPDVLSVDEAPDPVAGEGQVVVDVSFANITFVETQVRAGLPGPFPAPRLPMIPGNGVGGTVAAVGPNVDPGLIGQQVVTSTGGSGGYAEKVAVDATALFGVPSAVTLDEAVALLADGRTALWLERAVGIGTDDRVLIEAAAGGVGSLLVQLAHNAGAVVVAAAGGARKLALARDLGADVTVDYRAPAWADAVRDAVGGVDVALDGVGGDIGRSAFELVARGGRMLVYGMASGAFTTIADADATARGVTMLQGEPMTPELSRELTLAVLADAAARRLHPVIGQRFPLDRVADAHAAIEARTTVGKTLLVV